MKQVINVKNKSRRCGKAKASFTVEAAFLMPVVILLLAGICHLTIGLYQTTAESAQDIHIVQEIHAVPMFRRLSMAASWSRQMGGQDED